MLRGHNQIKCRNSLIHRAGNVMMIPFINKLFFFYSTELIFIYLDSDTFFILFFKFCVSTLTTFFNHITEM